ncbi:hypothetical protein NWP22_06880 [Anabaenopsis tanganyikae CS-531]|uniref:Uncharacterized protein n=1 Tax=Anabaenopsis tanganyikae CS-531 TaxID=2785304 RepID=A0ABT6KD28_9CYAN|nr:hypothetical protein [Anabaenopsis tanganyikae]MDH6105592.1 hypothetical protein [Anabaenopsis tanganyikae CS-531]
MSVAIYLTPSRIYPTLAIRQGLETPDSRWSKLLRFHSRSHHHRNHPESPEEKYHIETRNED